MSDELPYAAVDIDGVLADVRHRLHLVERRPKQWDAFFAAAPRDALLAEGATVVRRLALDHEVVYVTGRPESCRDATVAWLAKHDLPTGTLLMRRPEDYRPARETKVQVLSRLSRARPVDVLVDDDAAVVAAARAAGFSVLHADWMTSEKATGTALHAAQEDDGRT